MKSGGEFENIALKELFVIKGNPQLNKDSFTFSESGEYPYFTRTVLNNGIAGYVEYLDDEHKITGNCLAVGMLGMQFFYMEKDFYAGQFTKSAYPIKNKISKFNKNIAQYFIVLLNRYQKVFQGMLVRDFEKTFYESEVCLPVKENKIDVKYIELYMRELQKERLRELQLYLKVTNLSSYELTDDEINVIGGGNIYWDTYRIDEVFDVNTPKRKFDANKITFGGEYPYVARGDKNNGIRGYITEDVKYLNNGNTISFGQDTATMFYQEKAYFTGDKIKVFSLKNGDLNKLNGKFLISAMKKSFSLFSWGSSSFSEANLKQSKIQLPTKNNQIDFDYMETYIKAIQKLIIKDLVLYTERELKAYEQVID